MLRSAPERGHDSPAEFPVRRVRALSPGNLPYEITTFVGREREIAAAKGLLSERRLLTLTGPGGCGKTRLALAVARSFAAEFEDGIRLVELASLSDPSLVGRAVAGALSVREQPGRPLDETLLEHLASREALLVLDNCEHLIGECARFAQKILGACARARIMATSREPLGVAGEVVRRVPPLTLPESSSDVERIEDFESVRLFVERAKERSSGFSLTEGNSPSVVEICRKLGGMPLAIELAAARLPVLSPKEISTRLEDSLSLLTTGCRTASPRQRTLRATLEWSHDLLDESERALFRRLSVFTGGFSLEAAEAAGGGAGDTILDLLGRLVDKSLVSTGPEEVPRYGMLEPVRQYGRERLEESGEEETVFGRHAGFFLALAGEAEPELAGPEQGAWMKRLEVEHDNLRGALGWFTKNGDVERGFRLGGALWRFWWLQGRFTEGRAQLDALLDLPGAEAATEARAKALYVLGLLSCRQADHAAGNQDEARAYQRESLGLYRDLGDKPRAADALRELGRVGIELGDWEAADSFLEESLRIEHESGSEYGVALTLNSLGWLAHFRGENAVARPLFERARGIFRELEDDLYADICLYFLGRIATDEGDYEGARAMLAATVDERLPHYPWVAPPLLEAFAGLEAAQGQAARALRLAGAAAALREDIGVAHAPAWKADITRRLGPAWRGLDESAGEAAWTQGRTLALEEAVAVAMQEPSGPRGEASPAIRPSLRILALGPARVERQGHALAPSDWAYAKSRELLFYLLCHPPRTKGQVGLDLWPEASPSRLRKSFHNALYHLRRALGAPEWIAFENGRYSFDRDDPSNLSCYFDVEDFESKLAEARRLGAEEPERAVSRLQEAVELYGGDFLEDLPVEGEWALIRQEELRGAYQEALLTLGRLLSEIGRRAEAADAYRRLIAHDGLQEAAHRELMRCLALLGERSRAIRHYRDLVELLREQLGSAPAAETAALYESLLRGEDV